ncbi:MAG: NAD(P)H-hydrate dehydratase [Erysipelotrichales bacterium]|nr:NAD(P)H-hydrate dehydratase [Erysipelotrichales bacterium]
MNEQEFFEHFPLRKANSHKSSNGVIVLIGGSFGMAGAAILNILGARSVGTGYIHCVTAESVYPIVASHEITAVYHPRTDGLPLVALPGDFLEKADAVSYGSGCANLLSKEGDVLHLLTKTECPFVLDAEGLRVLAKHPDYLKKAKGPVILTPHLGEFAALTGKTVEEIVENREELAVDYAVKNGVILVLKGPKTLVVSPDGDLTINNSGNEALAQAGSGDVLTGIITGMCAKVADPYQAACMGVWFHGHLADLGVKNHSKICFRLEDYPKIADEFFAGRR